MLIALPAGAQNLQLTITLLTNPVPVEVTMATRDEKVEKREIIEVRTVVQTNLNPVLRLTNSVLRGYEVRKFVRTEIWTEVAMPVPPASSYPPPPIPFSKGSVRQSP